MSLTFLPATKSSRWQPGQSGNPKGRQGDRSLQELCRARTEEAVRTLIVMMRTKSPNQLPATLAILDRGWGKPSQRIEADGMDSIQLHLLAAMSVEPMAMERQAEPQQPLVIEGSIPTE
jgi:Family of unknown function (DUF5681)